jgi:hypothetical protein
MVLYPAPASEPAKTIPHQIANWRVVGMMEKGIPRHYYIIYR